jgi:hypothetical protein
VSHAVMMDIQAQGIWPDMIKKLNELLRSYRLLDGTKSQDLSIAKSLQLIKKDISI